MASLALQRAIAETYAAFGALPCPRRLHASPLRDADAILRDLRSASLAALPDAAIAPYSRWAITTVGTEQDFRHFLPRILELAATDADWSGAEPPIIADRILRAGWAHWPPVEREPVADLLTAAFAEALERGFRGGTRADDWLCGMAMLGLQLAEPLACWRADSSGEAALVLANFIWLQHDNLRDGGAAQGFWKDVPAAAQKQVGAWLIDPETVAQLRAATRLPSPEDGWEIQQALSVLGFT